MPFIADLQKQFNETSKYVALEGNHWNDHGRHFVGQHVEWTINKIGEIEDICYSQDFSVKSPFGAISTEARLEAIKEILKGKTPHLQGRKFRRLRADRDIDMEPPDTMRKSLSMTWPTTTARTCPAKAAITGPTSNPRPESLHPRASTSEPGALLLPPGGWKLTLFAPQSILRAPAAAPLAPISTP